MTEHLCSFCNNDSKHELRIQDEKILYSCAEHKRYLDLIYDRSKKTPKTIQTVEEIHENP